VEGKLGGFRGFATLGGQSGGGYKLPSMNETGNNENSAFEAALALHQQGQFAAAGEAYRAILADDPAHGAARLNLGHALRRLGRDEEAEAAFQAATELPDSAAGAWYNLGNLLASRRDFGPAEAAFRKSIELQPEMAPAHYQLGCVLRDRGLIAAAIEAFQNATTLDPQLTVAQMNLGNVLRAAGRLKDSAAAHRAALALDPESWESHYNLARCLEEAGDPGAEAHLEEALDRSPWPAAVHHGFAEAAAARAAFERALEHYRAAYALEPQRHRARMGIGWALMRTGRPDAALREFAEAARSIGSDIQLLSELATMQWSLKLREEPIALLRRVVQLAPKNPEALVNLARALSSVWEIGECIELCERALAIDSDHRPAATLRGYALVEMGRVDDGIAAFRSSAASGPQAAAPNASLLFSALYSDTLSAAEVAGLHRIEGAKWESGKGTPAVHANAAAPERRLRIGYLSPDFKGNHPVAIFLKPLLRHHDRRRFEIFGYSSPDYIDETTSEIQALVDHWRDVSHWSDERLARTIEDDRIDILIDLAGLTAKTRIGALRSRPAPLQMCYIGYPHSTGLPFIDYLIADKTVAPPETDGLLVEQPLRVDHCVFCYAPDAPDWPPLQPEITGARGHVVFGSFNHVPKLTDTTVALWSRILDRVPDSRLRLKAAPFADAAIRQRYRELFGQQGIAPGRLDLDGPSPYPDLMAAYRHIDIGLDPVPYNGGTTTYQALWMGVPVVTLAGRNFCSRMGASILSNLDLHDLIAEEADSYVDIAVRLANDRGRRQELRTGLRERILNAQSCDAALFTANLEARLRDAWRDWCRRHNAD